MKELDCKKPTPCPPVEEPKEVYPPVTPSFDFCAGNYTISWDGARLRSEKTQNIPDGEYGTVIFQDGCIVGVGDCAVPAYTPPFCNPNPPPCGDGSGGGSGSYSISPQAGNSLQDTALGLYAKTYIQAGSGVTVTGQGTQGSPYIVSASSEGSGGVNLVSDNPHIQLTTLAAGVTGIGLTTSGISPGTYNGFVVDAYGFITGFDADDTEDAVEEILAGTDIEVAGAGGGVYTIGHASSAAGNKKFQLGGFTVDLNGSGHITEAKRTIAVEEGAYAIDGWLVTVNREGSITNIEPEPVSTEPPNPAGPIIDIIEYSIKTNIDGADSFSFYGSSVAQPQQGDENPWSFYLPPHVYDQQQIYVTPPSERQYITITGSGEGGILVTVGGFTARDTSRTGKIIIREM